MQRGGLPSVVLHARVLSAASKTMDSSSPHSLLAHKLSAVELPTGRVTITLKHQAALAKRLLQVCPPASRHTLVPAAAGHCGRALKGPPQRLWLGRRIGGLLQWPQGAAPRCPPSSHGWPATLTAPYQQQRKMPPPLTAAGSCRTGLL
jgi:hypothetical protein